MKAKVKSTNEIYDIIHIGEDYVLLSNGSQYLHSSLEYITEPDWETLRIQIAAKIAASIISTKGLIVESKVADEAVNYTDELIKVLKSKPLDIEQ